ncbi:MAG: hypothetical protein ABMA64_43365, partial [Myxococcota bacterium]
RGWWVLGAIVGLALVFGAGAAGAWSMQEAPQRTAAASGPRPGLGEAMPPVVEVAAPVVIRAFEDDPPLTVPPPAPAAPTAPKVAAAIPSAPDDLMGRTEPTGYVHLHGDVLNVWLVSDGKRFSPDRALPAGAYQVVADFGGGAETDAGSVVVEAGKNLTLSCSKQVSHCSPL